MTRAAGLAALKEKGLAPRGLTRAEAAAYLGISARTFSKRVREGKLPGANAATGRWDRVALDAALDGSVPGRSAEALRSEIEAAIDES
ncbi:MAG: helix-turn-helix domain-containing protein [Proteobacteria bacterium]|nr:helix-turn-helix domain-containing protein [Pseudomonadota bacterium]